MWELGLYIKDSVLGGWPLRGRMVEHSQRRQPPSRHRREVHPRVSQEEISHAGINTRPAVTNHPGKDREDQGERGGERELRRPSSSGHESDAAPQGYSSEKGLQTRREPRGERDRLLQTTQGHPLVWFITLCSGGSSRHSHSALGPEEAEDRTPPSSQPPGVMSEAS